MHTPFPICAQELYSRIYSGNPGHNRVIGPNSRIILAIEIKRKSYALVLGEDNNSVGIILPVYSLTPSEPTLTVENVVGVMEKVAVEKRKEVWFWGDIVPDSQLEEIYEKYSTEEQRIHACADICINCCPDSSWTHLCQRLYGRNEMTAARKAKIFIPQTGEWYRVTNGLF